MCVYMYGCTHAAGHKWRSEDNFGIRLFSFTMSVPRMEIGLPSLVARTLSHLGS